VAVQCIFKFTPHTYYKLWFASLQRKLIVSWLFRCRFG